MQESEIRQLLAEVEERQKRAHETVCALCRGEKRWTMSVPAEPERDPDLVIGASLSDISKLAALLREKLAGERSGGIIRIAAERERQMSKEGWTPEHDAEYVHGELAIAAVCYASPEPLKAKRYVDADANCGCREVWKDPWPWDEKWDKRDKHDRLRRLEIAGALVAAEIDRLLALPDAPEVQE